MLSHLVVLSSLVGPLAPQGGPSPLREGKIVRHGRHYEVHVHYEDEAAAEEMLAVCERAWPETLGLLGRDAQREPEWPLGVHLYPTKDSYADVESWLTKGHFRDNESFSHWNSRTAHVALAPPLPGAARELVVLSSQTREVLAHEAAHLAVYDAVPTYRWHPTWLGEGLAMDVELRVARELGLLTDPGEHPRFSSNMLIVKRLLAEGRLPSVEAILTDSLDAIGFNDRYALWHEFFQVVRADEEGFRALMTCLVSEIGGADMRPRVAELVRERFGVERLGRELRERIAGLEPRWDQVYRSLDTSGGRWLQCAFPDFDAEAWRVGPVAESTYALAGRATPLSEETRMDLLLDSRGAGHVLVYLQPGAAGVLSLPGDGSSREILAAECAEVRAGEATEFRLDVDEEMLSLSLAGEEILRVRTGQQAPTGRWGVGVRRSGAGLWEDVRVVR